MFGDASLPNPSDSNLHAYVSERIAAELRDRRLLSVNGMDRPEADIRLNRSI
jgi:hypothetical protein